MSSSSSGGGSREPTATPPDLQNAESESPDPGLREAADFVREAVSNPAQPVVLFTISTCSYCWAVRRFFREAGIDVTDYELNSLAFTNDNRASRIRTILRECTGSQTLPQVFIAGESVGGATEVFEAFDAGTLAPLLTQAGIEPQPRETPLRASEFLPNRSIAP